MSATLHYFETKMYADRVVAFPGVGRVYGFSVGSCSHTLGYDMYFMAEGAESPVRGMVRFSTFVAEDGTLQWRFSTATGPGTRDWRLPAPSEHDQPWFPAEAMAAMRTMAETLGERDQTAWFFQTIGAIDMELNDLLHARARLVHTDDHLTGLLKDPSQPRDEFVPRNGAEKGYFRPATDEERAKRRATWQANIDRSRVRLAAFDAEKGPRVALLQRLRESMRGWSKRKDRTSVMELYALAVAEPIAQAA